MGFDSHDEILRRRELMETLHGRLPQGMATFDVDLRLVYANARWSQFQALTAASGGEPSPGTPFTDLISDDSDLVAAARQCIRNGETVELSGRRSCAAAGETFWDITLAPLVTDDIVGGVICVVDDATARVLAERDAAAKARLSSFRSDVSQALEGSDDIDAVLQSCAESMVRHAPAAFARIWVLDEAEEVYRLRASAGLYTRLDGRYSRIPTGWIRRADNRFFADEPAVAINLLRTHQVREPDWAAAQGLVSWASYPLVARGHIVGFMVMFARQNFDHDTLNQLAAVADAIAQFLQRKRAESALREREMLFRGVFESAADGLIISNIETGRVLEANPAVCRMHGYTREEFCELHRGDLIHPSSHDQLRDFERTIATGSASRVQLVSLRKDGSRFHAGIQGSPILYQGRTAVLDVVRDMTEEQEAHVRLEQRVAERTQELSLLLEISRNVASTLELQPLLELILDQLKSVVDSTGTAVLTLEGDELLIAGQRGPLSADEARQIRYPVVGLAPVWDRLSRGEAIVIADVRGASPEARVFRALVGDDADTRLAFIRSCLWAPLVVKERLIGLMSITRAEPNAFEPRQIEMAAAIARQAAVMIENARLHARAQSLATIEERQRLARELHDSVSQTLFGIRLTAQTARTLLERDPAGAASPLDYLLALAEGGIAETRALVFALRPDALATEGLVAALTRQVDSLRLRYELEVEAALGVEPDVPLPVKEALYRIGMEALHNTVKHAKARHVRVSLTRDAGTLSLEVVDDGVGFDPTRAFPGHLGQVSMRERAEQLDGTLTVRSAPEQGTQITAHIPIPAGPPSP